MSKIEIVDTRELPQRATVKIDIEKDGTKERKQVYFNKMDGMYGQWFDDEGNIYNFNGKFKQKHKFFYKLI